MQGPEALLQEVEIVLRQRPSMTVVAYAYQSPAQFYGNALLADWASGLICISVEYYYCESPGNDLDVEPNRPVLDVVKIMVHPRLQLFD